MSIRTPAAVGTSGGRTPDHTTPDRSQTMSNPMEEILNGIKRQLHDDDPAEFHGTEGGKDCGLCNPPPAKQVADAQRLALSEVLGLGTGAPWDAISARVEELRRMANDAEREASRG